MDPTSTSIENQKSDETPPSDPISSNAALKTSPSNEEEGKTAPKKLNEKPVRVKNSIPKKVQTSPKPVGIKQSTPPKKTKEVPIPVASGTTITPTPSTPDESFIQRQLRSRFSRADWIMGTSVIEDEYLVQRQGKPRKVLERAEQKFEEAVTTKIQRVVDKKVHGSILHFMMTICYAVSVTGMIEFPYMCYLHGGVTFLVPYGIILFLVGTPLMFAEMGLGQFAPLPTGTLFKAINLTYAGIGKAMTFVSFWRLLWNAERLVHAVYVSALAVPSIATHKSPWTGCNVTMNVNSDKCFDYIKYGENICNGTDSASKRCLEYENVMTENLLTSTFRLTPMFLDYMKTQILPQAFQINQIQFSPYGIHIVLAVTWIIVCILAIIGVRRAAVPLIITKTYAFIIYATFTVIACNATNSYIGRDLFFTFNSDHLWDGACWADAVKYVIISLSLCEGTIHKLGALSHFNTRFYKSVLGTVLFSFMFSFSSAVMFFSSISSVVAIMFKKDLANNILLPRIHEFMGQGRILMFTSFPEYLISLKTNFSYVLIMLYYICIAFITLPSIVMNLNKIFAAYEYSYLYRLICKKWPGRSLLKHILISTAISVMIFPCVFLVVQPWGQVIKDLMKHALVNALFIIGLAEILVVAYAYDAHRFIVDINSMHRNILIFTSCYLAFCYYLSTPFLLAAGCIYHFGFNQKLRVIDYVVPLNLMLFSVATFLLTIGPIFYYIIKRVVVMFKKNLSFRAIFQLTPYWVPPNEEDAKTARYGRLAYRAQTIYTKTKVDGEHDFLNCCRKNVEHK